ncbi:Pentatricopeptide repeat-containing protein, putative [Theobroma cacao]|uniref:Pentatricopeptide repeat-containing protein, putative n=1 Tax=Theobroma cacao TaxID=3641 RepID=A0A061H099_THECC|nr:Pentatricopeptide repeat-containing protein, putative [Theobroma cacao]
MNDASSRLSHLNLRLSKPFVLQVLSYGHSSSQGDVLSCLKFFDWAGRQPGFHHTRATFHHIFKILSKAKLKSVTLEQFLQDYMAHRFPSGVWRMTSLTPSCSSAGASRISWMRRRPTSAAWRRVGTMLLGIPSVYDPGCALQV